MDVEITKFSEDVIVVFVLGGPGSGKGTQCNRILKDFDFVHLSAGDLLREEQQNPNSKDGNLIKAHLKEGKIVPMEITVKLLSNKMQQSKSKLFLIDGFPRELDQAKFFSDNVVKPALVIFFNCDKEVMKQRILKRGETSGRVDDNLETLEKRFRVYQEQSLPVVDYYKEIGKVREISCNDSVDEVYSKVKPILEELLK